VYTWLNVLAWIGDYQYDIYRLMKHLVQNDAGWSYFYPKTNVYWIHYLVYQLSRTKGPVKYSTFRSNRSIKKEFQDFLHRILDVEQVGELLTDPFFSDIVDQKAILQDYSFFISDSFSYLHL
jgi:hypothetical protein